MAYVTVEDDTASWSFCAFPGCWETCGGLPPGKQAVVIKGQLSVRDEKAPQLMCDRLRPLEENGGSAEADPGRVRKLYLRLPSQGDPRWGRILRILIMFPGREPIRAKFMDTERWAPAYPARSTRCF